jgi:hypothetical protein
MSNFTNIDPAYTNGCIECEYIFIFFYLFYLYINVTYFVKRSNSEL